MKRWSFSVHDESQHSPGLLHLKNEEVKFLKPKDVYIRYAARFPLTAEFTGEIQPAGSVRDPDLDGSNDDDNLDDDGPTDSGSDSTFRVVICMTREQSRRLALAQYIQSDIAFKRVAGYQEFELGGVDRENKTCASR